MKIIIREMKEHEYPLLGVFLYEAIFIPEGSQPPSVDIIHEPALQLYIENFGNKPHDTAMVAEIDKTIIGAVWVRMMHDYGYIDEHTPSLAISLLKEYRGNGIGTVLMKAMLAKLKQKGYAQTSLSVQKNNKACHLYQTLGYEIIKESNDEYIMCIQLL